MEPETKRSRVQRFKEFSRAHPMVLPALIGIALYVLLGFVLWEFINPATTAQKKDFAQLMAQIAGGAALLFGLYFTWRRVEISERTLETQQDQQVTERFTRAIDQLGEAHDNGDPKLEIRLGGIYALERIAKDSPRTKVSPGRDYSTVIEVLTAYVRENAQFPSKEPTEATSETCAATEQSKNETEQSLESTPKKQPRTDIQAVLDVLGRRPENSVSAEYRVQLDLRNTNLTEANLTEAILLRSFLWQANLSYANLLRADLTEANLTEANLSEANLKGAILKGAILLGAILLGAILLGAKELTQEQLEQAIGDETTQLPAGLERPESWTQDGDKQAQETEQV